MQQQMQMGQKGNCLLVGGSINADRLPHPAPNAAVTLGCILAVARAHPKSLKVRLLKSEHVDRAHGPMGITRSEYVLCGDQASGAATLPLQTVLLVSNLKMKFASTNDQIFCMNNSICNFFLTFRLVTIPCSLHM